MQVEVCASLEHIKAPHALCLQVQYSGAAKVILEISMVFANLIVVLHTHSVNVLRLVIMYRQGGATRGARRI